jgi:hypothetical protein
MYCLALIAFGDYGFGVSAYPVSCSGIYEAEEE